MCKRVIFKSIMVVCPNDDDINFISCYGSKVVIMQLGILLFLSDHTFNFLHCIVTLLLYALNIFKCRGMFIWF